VRASNNDLGFKDVGNQYNDLISGWVAYWNYALKPKNPLHPNDLKALIASESGFKINAQNPNKTKKVGFARGLVQLTEQTYRILQNEKGELKDHLVILDKEEIWEPNKNICAAVRWLYRKYQTAQNKLKRNPTWEETFWEYKGILKQNNKDALTLKKRLKKFLEMISEGQNLIQK
ncbi:MAG: transglycosylase SLT domain-containing protein, partial [Pseudomonadota bacterium]